jgi:hypothetical protein
VFQISQTLHGTHLCDDIRRPSENKVHHEAADGEDEKHERDEIAAGASIRTSKDIGNIPKKQGLSGKYSS